VGEEFLRRITRLIAVNIIVLDVNDAVTMQLMKILI